MALWQAYCWWKISKPSKFNKSQLILSKNTLIGTFKSLSTLSTYLHISSEKWPKMTLWIVIIVHPRSTKTITKYHRKKKRSLRIFFYTVKRFLILFDYLSPYYWNISFFSPIWIRLEGSYIFKVFKDLLMIFVIQNFASFFFKVNETDWSRDFKFFLFARFSHNQPLLFLLIPHSYHHF